MKFAFVVASIGSLVLAGCSTIPTSGPTVSEVFDQAAATGPRYFDLIDIDDDVVRTLLSRPAESFHNLFSSYGKPPVPAIGIGDTVSVSIWEAAAGGLFGAPAAGGTPGAVTAAGGGSTTIPAQVVGIDGGITVPFAGRVPVSGGLFGAPAAGGTPGAVTAAGGGSTTIPAQVVGIDGGITVPFAGRVPVA